MATRRTTRPAPAEPPATDTRERILQIAWRHIAETGDAGLSLVELARLAEVSRQTLYLLFGSRAGLLIAMVDDRDARSGIGPRLARASESVTPAQAFEPYVRAWLEYLPEVFPVARALAAATLPGDPDAQATWQSRARLLRGGYLQISKALHAQGALRAGWTPAAAADWLYSMTHVDTWQHLVVEARWKPRDAVERIVATLRDTLLVDGGPSAG